MENKINLILSSHYNEDLNWLVNQTEYDYKIYTELKWQGNQLKLNIKN